MANAFKNGIETVMFSIEYHNIEELLLLAVCGIVAILSTALFFLMIFILIMSAG